VSIKIKEKKTKTTTNKTSKYTQIIKKILSNKTEFNYRTRLFIPRVKDHFYPLLPLN
jgi:hypothetical protein